MDGACGVHQPPFRRNQQAVGHGGDGLRVAAKVLLPGLCPGGENRLPAPPAFYDPIPKEQGGEPARGPKARRDGAGHARDAIAERGQAGDGEDGLPWVSIDRGVCRAAREAIGGWQQS